MGRIADMQKAAEEKKKKKKLIVIAIFVVIGIIIGIIVHFALGAIIALTPLVVHAMLDVGEDIGKEQVDLVKKIKEELAPKVIQMNLPNSEYLPYEGISEEVYKQAEYIENIGEYYSHDKINWNVENKNIEFAEINFNMNGDKKQKFIGMLGVVTLPRDIRTKIKINREGTYEKYYFFKANIENEEFESKFDVMSPNKNLAVKLLTEELANKILSLYNTYGYKLDINIIRNKLYVRIETGSIIINTNDGEEIDRNRLEKRYAMLKSTTELMDTICQAVSNLV